MTDEHDTTDRPADRDLVGQLIRSAGRRPEPPPAVYAQVLQAATAALQLKRRRQRQQRFALAASVAIVALTATWLLQRPTVVPPVVATVDRVSGVVQRSEVDADRWIAMTGEPAPLTAGSRLRTGQSSAAGLVLAGGVSLRLAAGSDIEVESATRVHLRAGMAYVDTAGATAPRIEITTSVAVARNAGTQFEVRFREGEYRLRTRTGRVLLERGADEAEVGAGEQLLFRGSSTWQRSQVASNDDGWRWAEAVAPVPAFEGKPVSQLLDWVGRETGRGVRYADAGIEQRAASTTLHGVVRDLTPLEVLAVLLATTDLVHVLLPDGTILVRSRPLEQPLADEVF